MQNSLDDFPEGEFTILVFCDTCGRSAPLDRSKVPAGTGSKPGRRFCTAHPAARAMLRYASLTPVPVAITMEGDRYHRVQSRRLSALPFLTAKRVPSRLPYRCRERNGRSELLIRNDVGVSDTLDCLVAPVPCDLPGIGRICVVPGAVTDWINLRGQISERLSVDRRFSRSLSAGTLSPSIRFRRWSSATVPSITWVCLSLVAVRIVDRA